MMIIGLLNEINLTHSNLSPVLFSHQLKLSTELCQRGLKNIQLINMLYQNCPCSQASRKWHLVSPKRDSAEKNKEHNDK